MPKKVNLNKINGQFHKVKFVKLVTVDCSFYVMQVTLTSYLYQCVTSYFEGSPTFSINKSRKSEV